MTAARRLRDLWLAGAYASAAGETAEDAASGEPAEHEPVEDHTAEEQPTEVDVTRRRPCVPRHWYGPSWKRSR